MTGRLAIVGLGPGAAELITPLASDTLAAATDLVGYAPYLARVPERAGQRRHPSDNREELARAKQALELAASGKSVAVVSSGDPGVFAMASAVFEAVETGNPAWRDVDVTVVPGVSAMLAAAARIGAPLGHDFCVISLSDNLKPWYVVLKRLEAAASGDFIIVLYNPASKARPWQLSEALSLARGGPTTRETTRPARFDVGDRVRTRNIHPHTHTRLPRYARDKVGTVERLHGAHVFPDSNARFAGEDPQWLYTVRFSARELWGREDDDTVSIDAFEPYLEPA